MRASWNLGRVAGIDLFLHPTFLLLLAFVGATHQDGLGAVLLISAVFGCVLLHELGHALMARQFGIGTADITIYPIGGVARLERIPRAPGAELLIALAGPAVNVLLAMGFGSLLLIGSGLTSGSEPTVWSSLLGTLAFINLGLAGFNLIPAFPMDGGRVVRALLSGWLGRLRATEIASTLGRILALAFGFYSLTQGSLLQVALAAFIYMAASAELAHVADEEGRRGGSRHDDEDGSRGGAPAGYTWVRRGQGVWQLCPIVIPVRGRPQSWR